MKKVNDKFKKEDYLDPKYWKLGVFYFNRNDNRIFPPKRNKILGWTVNFANPNSIFALIALIAILYVISSFF